MKIQTDNFQLLELDSVFTLKMADLAICLLEISVAS